ncbi:DNA mismatch repair protein MutT [Thioalkalivibrio denitrificans]|uniref:8-oxo-dGTP diphosphatase n=1 Tax=Thioalkalivibrio denitrificans TaxID=108003 RepID=A0A1V3NF24_9GAMM|nr:Nudix family hydrolase [Thioalkalivibrio denitrificans]OOG23604.1 DNA mismatch repair protein MutT [Thioalkalivibrio denitrificans]
MSSIVQVAVAAIRNSRGEYLISLRPDHAHQGGLWEFPGGKFEPGEGLEQALARELREELDIRVRRFRPLITIDHDYGDKRVCLYVCLVDAFDGDPRSPDGQPLCWVPVHALPDYAFPAANRPIVTALSLPDHCLITPDPGGDEDGFLRQLSKRLGRGDIRLMQLRAPSLDRERFAQLAVRAVPLARSNGVRILLNADPDLAVASGADGVHLNSRRLNAWDIDTKRDGLLLSASVHDRTELELAREAGADFAFISPVLPTATHPESDPLGWEGFAELARLAVMPVYALGGVEPGDLARTRDLGGQGVAGIRAFWEIER